MDVARAVYVAPGVELTNNQIRNIIVMLNTLE
jgi:hypothetical protein